MGRKATTTWTIACDQCGKDGGQVSTSARAVAFPLPEGWVESGKVLCSEECVIEHARDWYRDSLKKAEIVAA